MKIGLGLDSVNKCSSCSSSTVAGNGSGGLWAVSADLR